MIRKIDDLNFESEYEERDITQFLGLYMKHVDAMTSESLISKSRIAEELAFRDKRIAELEKELYIMYHDEACRHGGEHEKASQYATDRLKGIGE